MQLNDQFAVEPGNGASRDGYLADHKIETFLIIPNVSKYRTDNSSAMCLYIKRSCFLHGTLICKIYSPEMTISFIIKFSDGNMSLFRNFCLINLSKVRLS